MRRLLFIAFGVFLILTGCNKEDPAPTRTFLMGFTPFPYDISLEAVNYTYSKITTEGDMITHHFDNGIPWVEALAKDPYSSNVMNDWAFRKSSTPSGYTVCVAVSPLRVSRDGMALYRGESDDMPLPSPWDTYEFNATEVKTAYLNYCTSLIEYFHPHYFNMAVEGNLLYALAPDKWSAFTEFHTFIYTELKKAYPTLTIFTSVTGANLLQGFVGGEDYVQQRLAALQLLDHSDLYGILFYPYMSSFKGDPYPDRMFDDLFSLVQKPIAIAETGYPAQSFVINTTGTDIAISSDEAKQEKYCQDLLTACTKYKAVFVTQFAIRDYDQLWADLGSKNDLSIAWRDTGLYDENGQQRKAWSIWKSYLDRKKE